MKKIKRFQTILKSFEIGFLGQTWQISQEHFHTPTQWEKILEAACHSKNPILKMFKIVLKISRFFITSACVFIYFSMFLLDFDNDFKDFYFFWGPGPGPRKNLEKQSAKSWYKDTYKSCEKSWKFKTTLNISKIGFLGYCQEWEINQLLQFCSGKSMPGILTWVLKATYFEYHPPKKV